GSVRAHVDVIDELVEDADSDRGRLERQAFSGGPAAEVRTRMEPPPLLQGDRRGLESVRTDPEPPSTLDQETEATTDIEQRSRFRVNQGLGEKMAIAPPGPLRVLPSVVVPPPVRFLIIGARHQRRLPTRTLIVSPRSS